MATPKTPTPKGTQPPTTQEPAPFVLPESIPIASALPESDYPIAEADPAEGGLEILPSRGLDIGTANIASKWAVRKGPGKRKSDGNTIRDCFITFPSTESTSLEVAGVDYSMSSDEDKLFVIGDAAVRLSVATGAELRRPLARGFVSEKEDLSKEVVTLLLKGVLGAPRFPKELVVFSVPGLPMNGDTHRAQYHTRFFSDRLKELGYTPMPINEAMAVCFSELYTVSHPEGGLEKDKTKRTPPLTGLCFSFGAGMINVALVYQSMLSKAFSLDLGGDTIDDAVAKITNSSPSQVCLLKEEGVDLVKGVPVDPQPYHDAMTERQVEALVSTYQDVLTKLRDALNKFFNDPANRLELRQPIPVVVSGGTAQAQGFLQLFEEIVLDGLETRLPIERHARMAEKPLCAVAQGALHFARLRTDQGK